MLEVWGERPMQPETETGKKGVSAGRLDLPKERHKKKN